MDNQEPDAGLDRIDALAYNVTDLRRKFIEFGTVQTRQGQSLDIVNGRLIGVDQTSREQLVETFGLATGLREFSADASRKFKRLDDDFTWLRGQFISDDGLLVGLSSDIVGLKDNVTVLEVKVDTLQADMAELKTDVAELKTDVAELKTDVAELKGDMVDVKGSLKEILDRLPAKAA